MNFNILVLGIVHAGIAFPVVWTLLEQSGNSSSAARFDLLERFERVFPDAEIRCLTGDREFVGGDWLRRKRRWPITADAGALKPSLLP